MMIRKDCFEERPQCRKKAWIDKPVCTGFLTPFLIPSKCKARKIKA